MAKVGQVYGKFDVYIPSVGNREKVRMLEYSLRSASSSPSSECNIHYAKCAGNGLKVVLRGTLEGINHLISSAAGGLKYRCTQHTDRI